MNSESNVKRKQHELHKYAKNANQLVSNHVQYENHNEIAENP